MNETTRSNDSGASREPQRPGDAQPADGEVKPATPKRQPAEIGGPRGPEPTRYGDWEQNGRCTDF